MQLLEVPNHKPWGTDGELTSNIASAKARNLPMLPPALCSHDGTFVVVGSGPSLAQSFDEIAAEREKGRPICAVNGAHDFLCERGLAPDLFLSVDPRTTIIGNTQRKNPYTTYLIASRCHPELFDHLSDCKVMLWHSWQPQDKAPGEFAAVQGQYAIGGGTTSGTRAVYVGYVMGFRRFVVYGLDSCLADDGVTKRFSGEKAGKTVEIVVGGEGGRRFISNIPMAQQASEVQDMLRALPDATLDFKGPGLIAAIWEERRRRGLRT